MCEFFKNWWTIAWLDAFIKHWTQANQAWDLGLKLFEQGQLNKTEFDSVSCELSGKLFDPSIKPFYRPAIVFFKLKTSQSKLIKDWFAQHPTSLEAIFDGKLDENLPDWIRELVIEHPVKSFYCNCGQPTHYCEHLCALILAFLQTVERQPAELFRVVGLDLMPLLPKPIVQTIQRQQRIPSLSELLIAMANKLPQTENAKKVSTSEILSTAEEVSVYLSHVASLFPKKGSVIERSNLGEVVLKLLTETGRYIRCAFSNIEESNDHQIQKIFKGKVQFSFDGSTLEWVEPDSVGLKTRIGLINSLVKRLNGEPDNPLIILLMVAGKLINKGACLAMAFQPENNLGTLPRLLWFPPLGEPIVSRLLCALRSLAPSLLNHMDKDGLKRLPVFRILTNENCSQTHEKAQALDALLIGVLAQLMTGLIERANCEQSVRGLHSAMLLGRDIRDLDGFISTDINREVYRPFSYFMAPYILNYRPAVLVSELPQNSTAPSNYVVHYSICPGMASNDLTTSELSVSPINEMTLSDGQSRSEKFLPLETIFNQPGYSEERAFWRGLLALLATHSSVLEWMDNHKSRFQSDKLDTLRAFLSDSLPFMMMLGIRFFVDKRFKKLIRPKVRISAKKSAEGKVVSFFNPMSFKAEITIDGEKLTAEEAEKLLSAGKNDESVLVAYRDRFVEINPQDIADLNELKKKVSSIDPFEQLRSVISGNWNGCGITLSKEIEQNLASILTVKEEKLPSNVNVVLREYQLSGYEWLMKNIHHGMGAVLADDMGLGKTVQVICTIAKCLEEEIFKGCPNLIVVPAGLLHNWQQEFQKFAPAIHVSVWQANSKKCDTNENSEVILTTYGVLTRHFEQFSDRNWGLLIADEAQGLKNPNGARSQAFRLLKAKVVIAMTGTPVENRLMDIWSIFACVQPKLLGSKESFIERFAKPIERNKDPQALSCFKKLIAPFVLRREKTDRRVISDLPNCGVQDIRVKLTPLQAYLYEKTVSEILTRMQNEKRIGFLIIYLISELKRICNSPSLYLGQSSQEPDSAKALALISLVRTLLEENKKILIFTQYRQMGLKLQDWLEKAVGERPLFLNGSVPLSLRNKMIEQFQTEPEKRLLLITLKAGGVGLNLTAASAVIHYDLWWNPAVEQQATDRAYRIGQTQDVSVYRLICEGTFEERINDVIISKSRLAKKVSGRSDRWLGDYSQTELEDFFKLIA